jgi:hypothetical protein
MGIQRAHYDIISMGERVNRVSEVKNKIMLKKINGISQYA